MEKIVFVKLYDPIIWFCAFLKKHENYFFKISMIIIHMKLHA